MCIKCGGILWLEEYVAIRCPLTGYIAYDYRWRCGDCKEVAAKDDVERYMAAVARVD